MTRTKIEPGQQYNRWTVIAFDSVENKQYRWMCRCTCGNLKSVRAADLPNGKSKSCGCLQRERRESFDHVAAFWDKVDKTDLCWAWVGAKNPTGYGVFTIKGKNIYAHRYAYELEYGTIPGKLVLDHLCRHHGCVKPSHLEPVTIGENVLRGVIVRRRNMCVKELHPMTGKNVYINPTTGKPRCKACRDEYRRKYWLEKHDNRVLKSKES